jgi:hypothetical protein
MPVENKYCLHYGILRDLYARRDRIIQGTASAEHAHATITCARMLEDYLKSKREELRQDLTTANKVTTERLLALDGILLDRVNEVKDLVDSFPPRRSCTKV